MLVKINLTERTYGLEYTLDLLLYGIGILLLTPHTNNSLLKNALIFIVCLIGLLGRIYQFSTSKEKIDERAKYNFIKASNLTLIIITIFLMIVVEIIQLFLPNIKLRA